MTEMCKSSFYNTITLAREDNDNLKHCMESTMLQLLNSETSLKQPGILLGKIQSGKTRAFLGIIALAFDNGYDFAVVLTKGTKALTEQTLNRLHGVFGPFEDDNMVKVHDIMAFPEDMVPYELDQKLIIVAKKETNNLKRLFLALTETYPDLKEKKVLIIDDEADFASISFRKEGKGSDIEQGKIARQIDEIRSKVKHSDFLQVTATPYSLYLQPEQFENMNRGSGLFLPKRPVFTELLRMHQYYVGGNYYFIESKNPDSPAFHVYMEVPIEELEILKAKRMTKRADRRSFRIEEVFTSPITGVLRTSIMNFITGACIRRIQQCKEGLRQENYSFVIHTEYSRTSHTWQEEIVKSLNENLINISKNNHALLRELVSVAYKDLRASVELAGLYLPSFDEVLSTVLKSLLDGMLLVQKVNSDKDVKILLDNKGQLKLRTPLNIFIGGQILDRGITIKNMIGFYYGRNPKRFQQDTVLQHSRMYGARSKEDLTVTRFYTTRGIYEIMRKIHEFDEALRTAFKEGSHDAGVYFIRKDSNNMLAPCSPAKLVLSKITTLRPYTRLLPYGFQTGYKTNIKKSIEWLDTKIMGLTNENRKKEVLIPYEITLSILDKIKETFIEESLGYEWDIKSHKASLEYLSKNSNSTEQKGKVWVLVREGRDNRRLRADNNRFFDSPDTAHIEGRIARDLAINIPMLMLFRQNGKIELGWKGSPFWWPVIIAPLNTHATIFASDTF